MHHAAFANTPNFFDTLFACDDALVDQIYHDLTTGDKPLYSEADECWISLPTNPSSEHALYEPLVEIFNAITKACGENKTFNLVWEDVHSKKVDSETAVDLKPEIIGLLQACDYDSLDLWRLVQTPVEVKNPISLLPGLLQILRYCRQALYEQVDRRFLFGLVFAKTHLTVWHVDRSGTLGSESFNVHTVCRRCLIIPVMALYIDSACVSFFPLQNPKLLIHVIAGLTTKSALELGWDTHFKMVTGDPEKGDLEKRPLESRPSWEVAGGSRINPDNPYDQHWWILSMQKPKTRRNLVNVRISSSGALSAWPEER